MPRYIYLNSTSPSEPNVYPKALHLRLACLCTLLLTGCSQPDTPLPYTPPDTGEWQTVTPPEAGYDAAALEEVAAYAESQRSSGLVVLYDGRILLERYWEVPEKEGSHYRIMVTGTTADGRAIEDVASAQKSIISFLAGVAEGKGLLDLDAPVINYVEAGWSNVTDDQEAAITVRHLLTMSSGLLPDLTFEAPAGAKWHYNTRAYSRMVPVLESATGLSLLDLTANWLTTPTGMSESGWAPRPWVTAGMDANTVGFATTARDLARFGLLYLRGGMWNGKDLLGNPDYIERSTNPPRDLNPGYGYLWWLNGETEGAAWPTAPPDLYAARGALRRMCYVVPSLKLVVTRLGDQPGSGFGEELWRRIMAAAQEEG